MNLLGWLLMGLGLALGRTIIGVLLGVLCRSMDRGEAVGEAKAEASVGVPRTDVINAAANLDLAIRAAILSGIPIQIATFIDHSMPDVYKGGRPIVHVAVLDEEGNPGAQWPVRIEG